MIIAKWFHRPAHYKPNVMHETPPQINKPNSLEGEISFRKTWIPHSESMKDVQRSWGKWFTLWTLWSATLGHRWGQQLPLRSSSLSRFESVTVTQTIAWGKESFVVQRHDCPQVWVWWSLPGPWVWHCENGRRMCIGHGKCAHQAQLITTALRA